MDKISEPSSNSSGMLTFYRCIWKKRIGTSFAFIFLRIINKWGLPHLFAKQLVLTTARLRCQKQYRWKGRKVSRSLYFVPLIFFLFYLQNALVIGRVSFPYCVLFSLQLITYHFEHSIEITQYRMHEDYLSTSISSNSTKPTTIFSQ